MITKLSSRKKAQTALALAVSLWIANGGVASAENKVVNGETVTGSVYGEGGADNTVIVNNSSVIQSVYGGYVDTGNAVGNTVTMLNSLVGHSVEGGHVGSGTVSGNVVQLTTTTVGNSVYGGYTGDGNAMNNTVTMTRSHLRFENRLIAGGYTIKGGDATGNTVTLAHMAGVGGPVYGGYTGGNGKAMNNKVVLENAKADNVYGGYVNSDKSLFAEGNTVVLNNSKADDVYGGYVNSAIGNTGNNTVRLVNSTVHSVYGGNCSVTGNTLNLLGVNRVNDTVKNFETINIRSARWGRPALYKIDTETLQIVSPTITNTQSPQPTINADGIIFTNVPRVRAAMDTVLIPKLGNSYTGQIPKETHFRFGTTLQGKGKTKIDDSGDLVFTVNTKPDGTPDVEPQEETHNVLMGAGAGMATLSAGNDFIGAATEGLSQAANVGADGVSSYAQMGGGSIRQETGSHIDVKSWNAVLALGRKNEKPRGTFEYGAFFEYGNGNYTTHNGDLRGDGSTRYTGGGLLAKYTVKGGAYVEGSLRGGSVHGETRSVMLDENDEPYNCDVDAPYWGAHLGVGKEIALKNGDSVDVYGKFFLNRRNSTSFDFGGQYDLDALTSKVLRVGARYTIKRGGNWNYYGGLAYEHEFDGKASGTADGFAIRGTDPSGGSVRMELGATMEPDAKSPWKLDLNLSGFAGKKRGLTGGVSVAWMF